MSDRRELSVAVDSGEVFAVVEGSGPPLLLLHGWPLDHRVFRPQIEHLRGSLSIVAIDRRGFGRSTAPPDLAREPDDIRAIMDALALESAHLLGMSQGGRVALRFAALYPERLRSLLLQGTALDQFEVDEPPQQRIPLDDFAELAKAGRLGDVRRAWLAHPMMQIDDESAARLLALMVEDWRGGDLLQSPGAELPFAIEARLRAFDAPTLVITGGHDSMARRRIADHLLAILPNASGEFIADGGHLVNLSHPELYSRLVLDFVKAVEARQGVSSSRS